MHTHNRSISGSLATIFRGRGGNNTSPLLGRLSSSTSPTRKTMNEVDEVMTIPKMLELSQTPDCLVLLQIASAGKQGSELGTDESPVVMITAKIFDVHTQTITGPEFQVCVNYKLSDASDTFEDEELCTQTIARRDEVLAEECGAFTGLTASDLSNAQTLWDTLVSLDTWLMSSGLYYSGDFSETIQDSCWPMHQLSRESDFDEFPPDFDPITPREPNETQKRSFQIAVDGGTGLRLVLHQTLTQPVARTTALFPYLYRFVDIKKVFAALYPTYQTSYSLPEMMTIVGLEEPELPQGYFPEVALWAPSSLHSLMREGHLYSPRTTADKQQMKVAEVGFWPRQYCRYMAQLCAKMAADGFQWRLYEFVNAYYQPAFVPSTSNVNEDVVVRARGLPWQTTDAEIQYFFRGINIAPGGIALVLTKSGRRNGEAVIRFTDREQRDLALRKHKHHIQQRYIEIYAAQAADFISIAGGETEEAEKYIKNITSYSQTLIRMRGLPYTVSKEEIIDFFAKVNCPVQFGEDGILFVNRRDGRSTGDAFVLFANNGYAARALVNHRQHIGCRYIELFRSTPAEVNQVMNAILSLQPSVLPQMWSIPPSFDPTEALMSALGAAGSPNKALPLMGSIPTNRTNASSLSRTPPLGLPPVAMATTASTADCLLSGGRLTSSGGSLVRVKGMPTGCNVNDILCFLGAFWQTVGLHGIHLIYTSTGEPSGEAFIRFISDMAAQTVIASKQGHTMLNMITGVRSIVHLSLAGPHEIAEFISIPGSQPNLDWAAAFGLPFILHPYQLLSGGGAGAGLPTSLLLPLESLSQLPMVPTTTTTMVTAATTQGQHHHNHRQAPNMSTIKIDPTLLMQKPTNSTTALTSPQRGSNPACPSERAREDVDR